MDWCGIVGNVRVQFRSKWIVGYHWTVPNISTMPRKTSAVHYSPTFKFMDATWFLGIYWSSEEWIGMEIWRRSTEHPLQRVCFSVGLISADNLEYRIHRNQNYPEKDNVCSINRFLPLSLLKERKDHLAPWDNLTITCDIWPDVPSPDELGGIRSPDPEENPYWWDGNEVFAPYYSSDTLSGASYATEKDKSSIPIASKVQKSQMSASLPNIKINGAHSLDVIVTHDAPTTTMLNPSLVSIAEKPLDKSSIPISSKVQKPETRASLSNIEISGAHSLDVIAAEQSTMLNSSPVSIPEKLFDSNRVPRAEAEVVPEPPKEMLNSNVSATKKPVSKSGTHFGILREFSKGVEWEVALPPATSKSTWNFTSPRFRCGELRCFFNLCPRTDEDIWLRFTILSEDANFSLPIRWRLSVKSHDPQGLVGIINGWRSGDLENNQYVQEISIQRDDVESCLASGARITFVCHLSIGEVAMAMEDSVQQRENILVSCETQTEDDPDVEPKKIHSTADLKQNKESQKCDPWCLEIPKEEECIRHIQQSFERNLQKLLSENVKSRRKHLMSAA